MKKIFLTVMSYLIFLFFTILLTIGQVSLWPQLFNNIPAPQFWIMTLAYWIISRQTVQCLIMVYLLSFLVGALSAMPIGLILMINMVLFCGGSFLKRKIFWSNSVYLMILSGLGCLCFPFIHFLISWPSEAHPIRPPEFFYWFISGLFSVFLSPSLFRIFHFLDRWTDKEISLEIRLDIL